MERLLVLQKIHTPQGCQFGIKTYELSESISGYVWSFLIYTGQGMELTNQFVTAETNKTVVTVVKLSENLLGCGHTVCMDNSYNSPELAWFELHVLTRKMFLH
jgi:hypothetical protein